MKQKIVILTAMALALVLSQSCSKDKSTVQQPATNYSYDPASIKSILGAVDAHHGTSYSEIAENSANKERVEIIPGIVQKQNPGLGCWPYNWICEVIVWGDASGKVTGDSIADIIACTPQSPTLYEQVTIIEHTVTPDGAQTIFK